MISRLSKRYSMTTEATSISVLHKLALYAFDNLIDIIILLLAAPRSLVLFAVWRHLIVASSLFAVVVMNFNRCGRYWDHFLIGFLDSLTSVSKATYTSTLSFLFFRSWCFSFFFILVRIVTNLDIHSAISNLLLLLFMTSFNFRNCGLGILVLEFRLLFGWNLWEILLFLWWNTLVALASGGWQVWQGMLCLLIMLLLLWVFFLTIFWNFMHRRS